MNKIYFTLFFFLFSVKAYEVEVPFDKLADLNEQWLKWTSTPEAALALQHPPYSYHIKKPSTLKNYNFTSNGEDYLQLSDGQSCGDDLIQIVLNIKKQWALQMLDADGKLSSGVLSGGVIWPGNFEECISTYAPQDGTHGDFRGHLCMTSWSLNVSEKYQKLPLTIGLCLPDSCSGEYVLNFENNIQLLLERFHILKNHSSVITLKDVTCKLSENKIDASGIVYLIFISLILSLSIVGTIITIYNKPNNEVQSISVNSDMNGISVATENNFERHPAVTQISLRKDSTRDELKETLTENPEDPIVENLKKQSVHSLIKNISKCFSVVDNGAKILNTESSNDQLLSIHGIRFLSLTWVVLGHTYITAVPYIGNRLDVLKYMDKFAFQMLLQSPFSVDSFFLLSGFLLTYLFLKEAEKRKGKINWIYFYAHRLWRLTPAYLVVVFFYLLIFKYLGSGPFWEDNHCDDSRNSWWKYVLYINNFIPIQKMCVGWSWYLANDMQFYIISPLFLYPLYRWPIIGFSILLAFLINTWVITAAISYSYNIVPMFVGVQEAKDFEAYATKMWDSFDLIYDKPYCRIAPYIVGVILGCLLLKMKQKKNFLNKWQQILGWSFAAFCGLSVMFGLYHVNMSKTTAMFYNSLSRTSFSLSLAWLIFACETGHGGFLSTFLSWKFWIPLSRLTYSAYLVHPIFIHAYYMSYQTAFHFTEFTAVTNFLGFLVMSYAAAFVFSVVLESPFMNLEKLFLKKKAT